MFEHARWPQVQADSVQYMGFSFNIDPEADEISERSTVTLTVIPNRLTRSHVEDGVSSRD